MELRNLFRAAVVKESVNFASRKYNERPCKSMSGTGVFWHKVNSFLIAAFLALLIVWPSAYAVLPWLGLTAAVLGVGALKLSRGALTSRFRRLDFEDALFLLALLIFSCSWIADVVRTGNWPQARQGLGMLLPLWPVMAAILMVWLRGFSPALLSWRLGLSAGALGVGIIALYERFWLGLSRADNGLNAIPFGDVSLLLGVLALVSMLGMGRRPSKPYLALLLGLSAAAGLGASLLSGTRGGWAALPMLAWMIYRTFHNAFPVKRLAWITCVLGFLLVSVVSLPQIGVVSRVALAIENVQRYVSAGEAESSVGVRLDMWKAGSLLFIERPWVGWGEGRLEAERDVMVQSGLIHPGVSRFDQLHNEVIDTAARRGIFGLVALAGLYGVPLWLCSRHLRGCHDIQTRALALSGLIIPVAYIDFGLTQSLLRDAHGLAGYLGFSVICWALLKENCGKRAEFFHE